MTGMFSALKAAGKTNKTKQKKKNKTEKKKGAGNFCLPQESDLTTKTTNNTVPVS